MLKIYFVTIFFLFLFLLIDGIDEDLFDDLWKKVKPLTPKTFKKQKFGENRAIKKEIVTKHENYEEQNDNKITIKSENCSEKEMEDKRPKLLQKIKKEKILEEQNNNLKIKLPKIELGELSEESFENEFCGKGDQNVSSADQSNSADDVDYNNSESDKRNEMEILNKFNLMKKELRKENVYKNLRGVKFEEEIAKKLGTSRWNIYKLKQKLGQIRKHKRENDKTKRELIRKFDQLKKEKICGFKYNKKKTNEIAREIANELGLSRDNIYNWKKEFGLLKEFSTQQKIEKIKQFEKVKEQFINKFNLKPNWKIDEKIAEKIGIAQRTIYYWKTKFDFKSGKTKIYTDAEKLEYVKRSEEVKKRNPMMNEWKIAKKLGIPNSNLRRWTKELGTKFIH